MQNTDEDIHAFIDNYGQEYAAYEREAQQARNMVLDILSGSGFPMHEVSGRAKSPQSVRNKVNRKHYRNPSHQLTDLIGVRVIVFYHSDVEKVVELLRSQLEINDVDSIDKRVQLGLREFGYRSIQLIARVTSSYAIQRGFRFLATHWFEIQVRTILEHAWAEIEHQIVYKSGIEFPEDTTRRFASLAGTIELLEHEFVELRDSRADLIEHYRGMYLEQKELQQPFDVARLIGFLEVAWPNGLGWRRAEQDGVPFKHGSELNCLGALRHIELDCPDKLHRAFSSDHFRESAHAVSRLRETNWDSLPHPDVVALTLATSDRNALDFFFPDILGDRGFQMLLKPG